MYAMEGTQSRPPASRPLAALERLMAAKADSSYKLDEGYSEETRSQDGIDSPMRIDAGEESALLAQLPLGSSLQDAVLALGEHERRGTQ